MIDIELHFKQSGSKRLRLPTVPPVGAYITHDGKVWIVDSIVIGSQINVYVRGIGDILTAELEQTWGIWSLRNESD